ncbi:MAG: beta strand repeat-containing protein, partial [Rhodopirellula sp. JB044]|uniref:beta strand repeat-containing protein n=1 Tax=Rhodopirellula sp. JB044 TaxID=3342844 RepID=UPI00370B23BA
MNIDYLLQQFRTRASRTNARTKSNAGQRRRKTHRLLNTRVARLESLEQRQMLAGDLVLEGDAGANKIVVSTSGGNLNWTLDGVAQTSRAISSFDNLKIDGLGGNDTVHIHGTLNLGTTNHLEVIGESIFIGSDGSSGSGTSTDVSTTTSITAGDVTLTSVGDEVAASIGDNLPISVALDDRLIMVGDNVNIDADGAFTASGERTSSLIGTKRPIGYGEKNVEILFGSATIDASTVSVTAKAADENLDDQLPEWAQNNIIGPLQEFINDGILPTIPYSVMIRESGASIDLAGTQITASGDVTISSTTSVDASTDAVAVRDSEDTSGKSALGKILKAANNLSAGYSQATSRALVNVSGTAAITANTGSVSILSDATTIAEVSASTEINKGADELDDDDEEALGDDEKKKASPANTDALGASIAVSNTHTTSTATIAQSVTINAAGNVNIHATGDVTNAATSGLEIYVDGRGGIGVAVGLDEADVTATVDGTIVAGEATSLVGFEKSDIDQTVGSTTELIRIPDHGFETGEQLVYLAQDADDLDASPTIGNAIDGLTHGQSVRVVVIDDDHIQLTRENSIDLDARLIDAGTEHTLQQSDAIIIDPTATGVVDVTDNTIAVGNTVFTVGQRIKYLVGGSDPEAQPIDSLRPIGGLADGETYVVAEYDATAKTIKLSEPVAEGDSLVVIDLTAGAVGDSHAFGFTHTPITFEPATTVDNRSNQITFDADHGLVTGDQVTYRTDPTTLTTEVYGRTAYLAATAMTSDTVSSVSATTIIDAANDEITLLNHGFETGQTVQYSAAGTSAFGLSEGTDYYVVKLSDDVLQLSTTQTNPSSNIVNLSDPGTITLGAAITSDYVMVSFDGSRTSPLITGNQFNIPDHGLVDGTTVVYRTGGGDPVAPLAPNETYLVDVVDANTIQLQTTDGTPITITGGATLGIDFHAFEVLYGDADADTDTIFLTDHGLLTGDQVTYHADGSNAFGLVDNTTYEVDVVSADEIRLRVVPTGNDPVGSGSLMNLTTATAGQTHRLTANDSDIELSFTPHITAPSETIGLVRFDPTAGPTVDAATNTITFPGHGFSNGDVITYLNEGGVDIDGMTAGTQYTVSDVDGDTFKLTDGGVEVDLTTPTNVSGNNHMFERLSEITVGESAIRGLGSGQTYYVTRINDRTIRLSETRAGAFAAAPIELSATGSTATEHSFQTMMGSGIKIAAELTASNQVETGSGIGDEPKARDLITRGQRQYPIRTDDDDSESDDFGLDGFSGEAGEAANQVDNINNSFSIAGAVAYNRFTHTVLATTGATSVLESDGDIAVTASAEQSVSVKSQGTVISDGGDEASDDEDPNTEPKKRRVRDKDKTFAAGLALSIGDFTNTVDATVSGGSQLDAKQAIDVTSELSYPILADPFWIDPIAALPFGELTRSTIEDGFDAETFFSTDFREEFHSSMGPDLGLGETVNVWASTQIAGNGTDPENNPADVEGAAKYTFAASIAKVDYDNHSGATIGDGALVNQKASHHTADQSVNVDASTNIELVNLAGIMTVYAYAENIKEVAKGDRELKDTISPVGNRSGVAGLGGSALLQTIDNETLATIGNGALVRAGDDGDVTVKATELMVSYDLVQAGGESGKIGVSGSVSVLDQDNTTIAQIQDDAVVSGRNIRVLADDETSHVSVVGAAQTSGIASVGISVGVQDINRETAAIVGEKGDNLTPPATGSDLDIDASGDVIVDAEMSGSLWTIGIAGTKVSKTKSRDANSKSPKSNGSKGKNSFTSGIGLAGDVAWNSVTDSTRAYINTSGDVNAGGELTVSSQNETSISAVSGAIGTVSAGGLAVGLAGSFARNDLDLETQSWIAGADVHADDDVSVTADAQSDILAITAGVSGSKSNRRSGASIGITIAGSFSWNSIDSETLAIVDDAELTSGGDILVQAVDTSKILAVSAAVSATLAKTSKGTAVGVSASGAGMMNQLDRQLVSEIRGASTVTAGLDDGDLGTTETGHVHVLTTDQSLIRAYAVGAALSLAAGGAGTGVSVAVGVSIAENEIDGQTIARISAGSIVTSDDEVRVVAQSLGRPGDDIAGGLTASDLDDAAAADSDDEDTVPNEYDADRAGDASLKATLYQQIMGVPAPSGHVLTLSQLGSETLEPVDAPDDEELTDEQKAARDEQQSTEEDAEYQSDLNSDGSDKEADANLVGTSWMFVDETAGKTYIIYKEGESLKFSETSISAVAVAASLAAAGGKNGLAASGGGASTSNTILTEVLASVVGSTVIVDVADGDATSSGDLDVIATSQAGIVSTVVAAAASASFSSSSGGSLAIGAAVAENTIGDDSSENHKGSTRAIIDASKTIIEHDVNVSAITGQRISTTVIAGSIAISGSSSTAVGLGGAGASADNTINADAEAAIRNVPAPTDETDHQFTARDVSVVSENTSEINALAGAASLGIAVAGSNAVTVSISVGLAKNTITSQTLATIDNAHFERVVDTGIVDPEATP